MILILLYKLASILTLLNLFGEKLNFADYSVVFCENIKFVIFSQNPKVLFLKASQSKSDFGPDDRYTRKIGKSSVFAATNLLLKRCEFSSILNPYKTFTFPHQQKYLA